MIILSKNWKYLLLLLLLLYYANHFIFLIDLTLRFGILCIKWYEAFLRFFFIQYKFFCFELQIARSLIDFLNQAISVLSYAILQQVYCLISYLMNTPIVFFATINAISIIAVVLQLLPIKRGTNYFDRFCQVNFS